MFWANFNEESGVVKSDPRPHARPAIFAKDGWLLGSIFTRKRKSKRVRAMAIPATQAAPPSPPVEAAC